MVRYLFLILLLLGCSGEKIYREKSKNFTEKLECVQVDSMDIDIVKKYLLTSKDCKYILRINPHIIHKCYNPQIKSLGGDIDNYVRLELFHRNILLFRSQIDFKGDNYLPYLEKLLLDFVALDEVQNIKRR